MGLAELAHRNANMESELRVKPIFLGMLIGPGGKTLKQLEAESGATVVVSDSGRVTLTAPTQRALARAEQWIRTVFGPEALDE